jgi:metallo-beta-lactamase family protein
VKLHFLGANRQVTGSRYCLEAGGKKILIDCGMFQERPFLERNWEASPVPPSELAAMLLTHVHIDHSGLIPKLVRDGFNAPIHATRASAELAPVMLYDAAKIQMEDAEYKKKRHKKEGREGKHPVQPLYTDEDVDKTLPLLEPTAYLKPVAVTDDVSVTFHDAGHILGSAMLEVLVKENGQTRRVLFSGDIGQWDKPLIRDPSLFEQADYVVMESTYGDRNHQDGGDVETQLSDVINDTISRGGNVVIPTFAVERAQELMYYIGRLVHGKQIPSVKVFVDSPMAVDVTEIFRKFRDCLDDDTWELISSGHAPLGFPGLQMVRSVGESKAINDVREPCIIMSTSGMCTAGRIKHHLRQNITRPHSTILFVGYQGQGTLGRQILDGSQQVRIHGKNWPVKAKVSQIYGFSGHADRAALLRWLGNLKRPPRHVFLTHGEEDAALNLAQYIDQQMHWPVTVPEYQEVVELN